MSNDSTSAGYLTPTRDETEFDEALERRLHLWVAALSGLAADRVCPRWTPEPPEQPALNVNWCGFGITDFDYDGSPAFIQQDESRSEYQRHELIECLASFYGPASQRIAAQFRDGITVSQNNETINADGLSLHDYSKITPFPEFIDNQWVRRYDITVRLRRKVVREYGIKSLVEAPVTFFGD